MSLTMDGGPVGLGFASTLLQANLGVGLALIIVGAAVTAGGQLKGVRWEATLRAAGAATTPVALLAVFGLVQSSGAAPDFITWLGLLVATASVLCSVLLVALCPGFGLEVPVVTRTGEILTDAVDSKLFSTSIRAASALRAFGQALLIFSAVPAGVQLLFASLLLRLALGFQAVSTVCRATGLLNLSGIELRGATMLASFALLDHLVWGPGSAALAIFQPTIWGAAVSVLLLVVNMMERDVNSQDDESDIFFPTGQDVDDGNAPRFGALRHFVSGGVYATMAAAALRVFLGTFNIAVSTTSISVKWGEPLLAAAALLAALVLAVFVLEFMTQALVDTTALKAASTAGYMKAIAMPAQSLVLALIAAHLSREQPPDPESTAAVFSMFTGPLSYGFVMAGVAVAIQELLLIAFVMWNFDSCPALEPPLDSTGTLNCAEDHPVHALQLLRGVTQLLLQGGLLMGLFSLGNIVFWTIVAVVAGSLTLIVLPADAQQAVGGVSSVVLAAFFSAFGGLTSSVQAVLKERDNAKLAQMAKKADEMAAAVAAEGDDAKDRRKSATAPAAVQTQAKVTKAKGGAAGKKR